MGEIKKAADRPPQSFLAANLNLTTTNSSTVSDSNPNQPNHAPFDWRVADTHFQNPFSPPSIQSNSQSTPSLNLKYFIPGIILIGVAGLTYVIGGAALANCHSSSQDCGSTGATFMVGGSGVLIGGIWLTYKGVQRN